MMTTLLYVENNAQDFLAAIEETENGIVTRVIDWCGEGKPADVLAAVEDWSSWDELTGAASFDDIYSAFSSRSDENPDGDSIIAVRVVDGETDLDDEDKKRLEEIARRVSNEWIRDLCVEACEIAGEAWAFAYRAAGPEDFEGVMEALGEATGLEF